MPSALLFIYGTIALLTGMNALRKPTPPTSRFPPIWLPAMIVGEAPWLYLAVRTVIAVLLMLAGGLELPMGRIGLTLVVAAQVMTLEAARRAYAGASRLGKRPVEVSQLQRLASLPFVVPDTIERREGEYAPGLAFDLYRSRHSTGPSPTLIYIHGGSWGGGDPRRQFRTVTHYLAENGWVVVAIRYPLSPRATFPDHLLGVQDAIQWARTAGTTFGVDPDRVAVAGGSAGAHLASLAALTPGSGISAAVVLYGIYDFFNRNRTRFDWPLIPRNVMKTTPDRSPELYRSASPIDQVHPDAPPFLVVHGTHDSLVPIGESRLFVEAMREVGGRVELVEVHGAQHAFDALGGVRTRALAAVIREFLDRAVSGRHQPPTRGIMET
ncbi:MAG TPA: alpha/beta hydrolase [Acidimicrobiia bacterium]|nr:alpha/beta hydrolase [Acidimicrobiia bacterium]